MKIKMGLFKKIGVKKLLGGIGVLCLAGAAYIYFVGAPSLSGLPFLGGAKEPPIPEAYVMGEDSLPALTQLVDLGEVGFISTEEPVKEEEGPTQGEESDASSGAGSGTGGEDTTEATREETDSSQASEEEEAGEEGGTILVYHYSGLAAGNDAVEQYVGALEEEHECYTVDELGEKIRDVDYSPEIGTVRVAKDSVTEGQMFQLEIQWTTYGCTVVPSLVAKPPEAEAGAGITMEEAAERLEGMSPAQLGLPGEQMSNYLVMPQDGYVMVDGDHCYLINVYQVSNHQFAGTYMLSVSTSAIYQLDRITQTVTRLPG